MDRRETEDRKMSLNCFKDKNASILLVVPSASVRNQHREVLREKGFSKIIGASDLLQGKEVLETEVVDWIITPILDTQSINAFMILNLIINFPQLRQAKLTMIVEESHKIYLEDAFDLGLMSWFEQKSSMNEISAQYDEFFDIMEQCDWNTTKVSAIFLKNLLINKPPETLRFFKKIAALFPGDGKVLFELAKIYFINKAKNSALMLLKQVVLLEPAREQAVQTLIAEYGDINSENEKIEEQNTLGIKKCAIIDGDEVSAKKMHKDLTDLGVPDIKIFKGGNDFLKDKDINTYQLVLFEWALPDIPSPILIQKLVYEKEMISVPFIALSNNLTKVDLPLLQELGVITFINKPIVQFDFYKEIIWSLQQQLLPTEPGTIELKIRQHITGNNLLKAKGLFAHYKNNKAAERSRLFVFEAEFAYHDGKFFLAKTKCVQAIREGSDSVFVLSLLGKILMKLRDFGAALRCLDLAHSMSPLNIKRICAMSECYMESDDLKKAQSILDEAIEVDSSFEDVKMTQSKLHMLSGDTESAKKILKEISSIKDVISFMNNRAVSLAVCDRVDEGIDLYRKTLDSIPDNLTDILSSVHYNLALAYAREKNLEMSLKELKNAQGFKADRMKAKIFSIQERIKVSIKENKEFKLKDPMITDPKSETEVEEQQQEFMASLGIKKGELCCYKIFIKVPREKIVEEWIKKKFVFNPRTTIKKIED